MGSLLLGLVCPFHRSSIRAVRYSRSRHLPIDILITLSTSAAYVSSLGFLDGIVSIDNAAAAALIVCVVSLGKHLEARFKRTSVSVLAAYAQLLPPDAQLLNRADKVPLNELKNGDGALLVEPGQRFPCDGVLTGSKCEGLSLRIMVDESLHTGESSPVAKEVGDVCLAGTINSSVETVIIDVVNKGQNIIDQLLDIILQGQAHKSSLQSYVDGISQYLVPGTILCASIAFLIWLPHGLNRAIGYMTATLVVICPCALGLSMPAVVLVTCGRALSVVT